MMADAALTMEAATAKDRLGAQVVTQTLDKINQGGGKGGGYGSQSDMAQTYAFSKEILSAAYEGKGIAADIMG
ncbi:MAG: hypothetical protein LBD82_00660 [Deltaproteobacteria bacterium]|nr:hypothetical protein [Deltaproteobacteria bacterium]